MLYQQSGLYLSNKLYTINALHDLKITDDCFVLPEKLLTIDDEVVGFTMPLINGITLADIIYNADVDIKVKVKYLKKWRYFR